MARKTWSAIKHETMTSEERNHAHTLAMQDVADFELRELREALKITQVTLSKRLKTTQAAISRLEKRPNVLVETLDQYVEALGGKLELRAVFADRTVGLTHAFRRLKQDRQAPNVHKIARKIIARKKLGGR